MALFSNISPRRLAIPTGLVLFGAVSYLAARFDTFPGDQGALTRFQALRSGWLDEAAEAVTFLANAPAVVISIVTLVVVLWWLKRRRDALIALLIYVPEGLALGVKELVGRPRPEFSLLDHAVATPSFPSGHAVHAVVFFCFLSALVGDLVRPLWLTRTVQVLLWLVALGIGASRVYLGAHWPSDVLGAYLFGAIFLLALLWLRKTAFMTRPN